MNYIGIGIIQNMYFVQRFNQINAEFLTAQSNSSSKYFRSKAMSFNDWVQLLMFLCYVNSNLEFSHK